jgi:hypothetical protein
MQVRLQSGELTTLSLPFCSELDRTSLRIPKSRDTETYVGLPIQASPLQLEQVRCL